jgi:TrmH family RNA methyltransferase
MIITSPANERLKHARRVREGREPDLIFVEGERLVEECLQAGLILSACFHSPDLTPRSQAILEEIRRRGCPVFPVADAVMANLSDTVNPQGIIVLAERPASTFDRMIVGDALIVCLDGVQDPGNFGSIVRTAEAAGATGVAALKGTVEAFAPKTLRGAMGSAFRLPIISQGETEEIFAALRGSAVRTVAMTGDGETVYSDYDWRQPTLVVLGNEARGVSPELLERCDARLRIPMRAPVESLNVAAAAAVVLFEAARQRENHNP